MSAFNSTTLPVYLTTILLAVAVVLQLAVDRAPDLKENRHSKAARRVLIAGLTCLLLWMVYRCVEGVWVHPIPLMCLCIIALAEVMFCVIALFPDLGKSIERTRTADHVLGRARK